LFRREERFARKSGPTPTPTPTPPTGILWRLPKPTEEVGKGLVEKENAPAVPATNDAATMAATVVATAAAPELVLRRG